MKKTWLLFVIIALLIFGTGLWILTSSELTTADITDISVITLLVAFALFIGIKRFVSAKKGEPEEDELSKKVLQKTAALSYYISLYIWVILIYVKDRIVMNPENMLGYGILGMAVTYAVCWLFFHLRGVGNE